MQGLEEWYINIGRKWVRIGLILVAIYLFFRLKAIEYIAPFIIAYLFAMLLNPFVTWLNKKVKIPRGIAAIFSMLTILSGVLGIISMLVRQLWHQMVGFASAFPDISSQLIETINDFQDEWGSALSVLPASEVFTNIDTTIEKILEGIGAFFTAIIPGAYNVVSKVPDMVIFIIVMLIATFFITRDYQYIKNFIKAQLSETVISKFVVMQDGLLGALGGYVKTQVILMSITFGICLVGLFVLGINYALLLAIIIAIVDALPVFGSGTILIPWAIYNLVVGDLMLAIGLLGIYGIIFITRQIMEPKILSTQIGVYALVTVISMYIGYKAIGVLGLILGPIVAVCVKTLQAVGVIPPFKPIKEQKNKGK
ncbi:sporulation integral membrane protein YtvI [Sporanaerobium hydrogeniformans]|uniref:sporulation integral membrane protein YtvI n=1 Tax=Sporanaerobium hydrogeniformans TaxID=3072179 RepID=UPI0015D4E04B|nr:sporulation integral membrane protein YtvI [Sporanaerobium hydrogeniformans]